jgi:hypothetical protein
LEQQYRIALSRFYPASFDELAEEFPGTLEVLIGLILADEDRRKPKIFGSEEKIRRIMLLWYPLYLCPLNGSKLVYDGRNLFTSTFDSLVLSTSELTNDLAKFEDMVYHPIGFISSLEHLGQKIHLISCSTSQGGLVTQYEIINEVNELYQNSIQNIDYKKETILEPVVSPDSLIGSSKEVSQIFVSSKKSKAFLKYIEERSRDIASTLQKSIAMASVETKEDADNQIAKIRPDIDRNLRKLEKARKEELDSIQSQKLADMKPIHRQIRTLQFKLTLAEKSLGDKVKKLSSMNRPNTKEAKKFWNKRISIARKEIRQIEGQLRDCEKKITALERAALERSKNVNLLFNSKIYSEQEPITAIQKSRDLLLDKLDGLSSSITSTIASFLKKINEALKIVENSFAIFDSMTIKTYDESSLTLLAIPVWVALMGGGKREFRTIITTGRLIPSYRSGLSERNLVQRKESMYVWKIIEQGLKQNPICDEILQQRLSNIQELSCKDFSKLLTAIDERRLLSSSQTTYLRNLLSKAI